MLSDDYGESIAMEIEKTGISDDIEKENVKEEDAKMAEPKPEESISVGVDDPAADTGSNPATDASTDPAADDKDDDASDDDDDDLSDTISDTDSDKDTSPKVDPEMLLLKATALKEEGNNFFKENDFEKAGRSYRRGVQTLKPLNKKNTGDEQVKALLLSLQTNLSMMLFKQEKFKQSLQVATHAIQIESSNVKARYRRAVAHRKLGNLEEARDDLRVALKTEEKNVSVRKELAAVKKALETAKESQKKSLVKAFSRGSSLLYDDKEEQERQKEELAKMQKILEEEKLKKRKLEWEDECVKRMAKGEKVLSFEEWEKERQDKENAEKKKKRKEEKLLKEERRKSQAAAKKQADSDPDDDDELTEKEMAQLRGYKKTADGRVTSYFTKELSETEKNLIGDIAPKKLDSPSSSLEPTLTTPSALGETAAKGRPSAWNQSGTTWEEKDTTEWCRKRLKSRLKQTKAEVSSGPVAAIVTKVENMVGDASVAISSGKKRYIFDFHCKVIFDVRNPDTQDVLATGSLQLPDICSTHHEELDVTFSGWTKSPEGECIQNVSDCQVALCSEIRESIKLWVTDFNEMY